MALSHGSNDAQKTMGIIAMSLAVYHGGSHAAEHFEVPIWVMAACAIAMGAGTMSGGVRIIKTMGTKIIDLKPIHGFAAETSAAATILAASHLGLPVSTTHVISGAIMGVGSSQRVSAVRWGVTARIAWAWVLTIPISAAIAWACYHPLELALGVPVESSRPDAPIGPSCRPWSRPWRSARSSAARGAAKRIVRSIRSNSSVSTSVGCLVIATIFSPRALFPLIGIAWPGGSFRIANDQE